MTKPATGVRSLQSLPEPRKPIPYTSTWGKGSHLRKTQPFEAGAVVGWLTVVGQLGNGVYSRFRCRCGETVDRMHADVRKSLQRGSTPACMECGKLVRREKLSAGRASP